MKREREFSECENIHTVVDFMKMYDAAKELKKKNSLLFGNFI